MPLSWLRVSFLWLVSQGLSNTWPIVDFTGSCGNPPVSARRGNKVTTPSAAASILPAPPPTESRTAAGAICRGAPLSRSAASRHRPTRAVSGPDPRNKWRRPEGHRKFVTFITRKTLRRPLPTRVRIAGSLRFQWCRSIRLHAGPQSDLPCLRGARECSWRQRTRPFPMMRSTHGTQQMSFFNAYFDTYCYLPLVG
jgi:hypothetical protein